MLAGRKHGIMIYIRCGLVLLPFPFSRSPETRAFSKRSSLCEEALRRATIESAKTYALKAMTFAPASIPVTIASTRPAHAASAAFFSSAQSWR
jgi:hypothetical protein